MKAVRVHANGGPEALRYEDVETPRPKPGEVLVKIELSGVNFIDVQYRAGKYKPPQLPFVDGMEAAGTVAELGRRSGRAGVSTLPTFASAGPV